MGHDRVSYTLGGSVDLTASSRVRGLAATTSGAQPKSDAFMWALGYDYLFNDDIRVYLDVAAVDNDAHAFFSVNSKGHGEGVTPLPGQDQFVFSVGFVATFNTALLEL